MKKKLVILAILAVALGAGGYYFLKNKGNGVQFKTEKVTRGDLRAMVTATGTVSAVTTVLVGTQVSGTIKELFVDFNSPVKKGQLLAQIDPALSQAKVAQAKANLQAAEAGVEKAMAALQDASRTFDRNKTLFGKNYIARSDLDTSETNLQGSAAQVSVTKAQVEQARAALQQEETNFLYTRIISPVDGIVISRNVDIGQTVAASFQTPTLFSIAQDLTRMQIDTNVDEADIGRARLSQAVQFTVDAYPDVTFSGKVSEIRNAPTVVSNVVTYDVVVRVANPELKLKPGMTANVSIITDTERDVLKIPNAALRFKWTPPEKDADPEKDGPPNRQDKGSGEGNRQAKAGGGEGDRQTKVGGGERQPKADGAGERQARAGGETGKPGKGGGDMNRQKTRAVWVLENQKPRRVPVTLGISDGNSTVLTSDGLKEGDAVIIDTVGTAKKEAAPRVGGRGFF